METTLHRQLKALYAPGAEDQEVVVGSYRVDARRDGELVEVQFAPLHHLARKATALLQQHSLRIVKPWPLRRHLVRLDAPGGRELGRRWSPRREALWGVFGELVYFLHVFPHPRLCIEVLGLVVRQWRYPRRRPCRWGPRRYQIQDQELLEVCQRVLLRRAEDLWQLLPAEVPEVFDTATLAQLLNTPRWMAQQIAYCLRRTGAAQQVGKRGNCLIYRVARR